MIQQAITMGYTAAQILKFISSKFKSSSSGITNAQKQGYDDEEILRFLSGKIKPKNQKNLDSQLSSQEKYLKSVGINTKEEKSDTRNRFLSSAIGTGITAIGAYNAYKNYDGMLKGLGQTFGLGGTNSNPPNNPETSARGMPAPGPNAETNPELTPSGFPIRPPSPENPQLTPSGFPIRPQDQQQQQPSAPQPVQLDPSIAEDQAVQNIKNRQDESTKLFELASQPKLSKENMTPFMQTSRSLIKKGDIKDTQTFDAFRKYWIATEGKPRGSPLIEFEKFRVSQPRETTQTSSPEIPDNSSQTQVNSSLSQINSAQTPEKIDLTGMGKGITENFYNGIFQSLKDGKDTFSGVKDTLLQAAKPAFDAGQIKSVDDLKKFAKFYEETKKDINQLPKKGEQAFSSAGLGTVKGIHNGKAILDVDGKKHLVDESSLKKQNNIDPDVQYPQDFFKGKGREEIDNFANDLLDKAISEIKQGLKNGEDYGVFHGDEWQAVGNKDVNEGSPNAPNEPKRHVGPGKKIITEIEKHLPIRGLYKYYFDTPEKRKRHPFNKFSRGYEKAIEEIILKENNPQQYEKSTKDLIQHIKQLEKGEAKASVFDDELLEEIDDILFRSKPKEYEDLMERLIKRYR